MGWLLCQWSVIPTCHLVATVFADTEALPEPVDLIALVDRVGCEADEFRFAHALVDVIEIVKVALRDNL